MSSYHYLKIIKAGKQTNKNRVKKDKHIAWGLHMDRNYGCV